jgi:hypothetical protein
MYVLSVQYSCAVVSVFLFGGKANLVLLALFYSTLLALTDRWMDGQRVKLILVVLATLTGSSMFILFGLATLTGSSR